jgi:hypothetical protein
MISYWIQWPMCAAFASAKKAWAKLKPGDKVKHSRVYVAFALSNREAKRDKHI